MKTRRSKLPQLLIFSCLCASCSIKENRSECPCHLDVTLSGAVESSANLSVWNSGLQFSDNLNNVNDGTVYQCDIRRGKVCLSVCSGSGCAPDGEGNVTVAPGEQMAELYACAADIDATSETASSRAELLKQFALLHLNIKCLESGKRNTEVCVSGNCDGMNVTTLTPHKGPFSVKFNPVFGEYCRVCLPRQYDNSLQLHIDGYNTIDLGKCIADSGYDWKTPSLEDIYVDIDVVSSTMDVKIASWELGDTISFKL